MSEHAWVRDALSLIERVGPAGVGVSGGKESLALAGLVASITPVGTPVFAFHAVFGPGSKVLDAVIERTADRWKMRVERYPHPHMSIALRSRLAPDGLGDVPNMSVRDLAADLRKKHGLKAVLFGHRLDDPHRPDLPPDGTDGIVWPLRGWTRTQVIEYLVSRDIPLPPDWGRPDTGIFGLNDACLRWMETNALEDLKRLYEWFPLGAAHMEMASGPADRPAYAPEVVNRMKTVIARMRELARTPNGRRGGHRRRPRVRVRRGTKEVSHDVAS